MSPPPFVFNHRTGDLQRQGKAVVLGRFHADIFNCFATAQTPIGKGAIAKAIGAKEWDVEYEIPELMRRLKPLGIRVASATGRGRWLVFEDVPKWKPKIAPPVVLPGEQR